MTESSADNIRVYSYSEYNNMALSTSQYANCLYSAIFNSDISIITNASIKSYDYYYKNGWMPRSRNNKIYAPRIGIIYNSGRSGNSSSNTQRTVAATKKIVYS